ncbi:MAG: lactate racemase domain-containing protein [Rectinemataceae bacterium]|jgi:hypothetical protein
MKLDIPYLGRKLELEVPDANLLAVAEPNEVEGGALDAKTLIAQAVAHPLDSPSLVDFLARAKRLLVIMK